MAQQRRERGLYRYSSYRYSFDSLRELGQYLETAPYTWSSRSSTSHAATDSWDLEAGYEGAVRMAVEGWPEGAQRAHKSLRAFAPLTPAPDTKTDFYGFRPHVPRYCAGAPDNMIRRVVTPQSGAGKVLTLYVPVNALARVPASCMANFGLAVAQYVNQLESEETRVELHGVLSSLLNDRDRVVHSFKLKGADQPLDLAVVAFAIGHPAMFRRLGFAARERCAANQDWSYGASVDCTVADLINPPAGAVVLNGMRKADTHAKTPDKALEYITKQIDAALAALYGSN